MRKSSTHYIKSNSSFVSLIVFVVLLLYLFSARGQESSFPQNPMKGKLVFEQKGCKKCHAVQGEGGNIGPDLSKDLYCGSFLQLAGIMWNHAPRMLEKAAKMNLKIEPFSTEEMKELLCYLGYLHYLGQPGNHFRGQKLLKSKKCLSCHKLGDQGQEIGPDLTKLKQYVSPLFIVQAMWNHGPEIEKKAKVMNIKFVKFNKNEITDITAAIKGYTKPTVFKPELMMPGDPKKGEKLFRTKNCIHCHAVHGEGGNLAPDLGHVRLENSVTEIAGIMWNHGPKMWELIRQESLPYPKLKESEMADLVAYIYFLRFNDQSGDMVEGEKIFKAKGCAECHSINGVGGKQAADLAKIDELVSPIGMVKVMWNHAPHMIEKTKEKKLPWPKFKKNDVPNLYAYLKSIRLAK